ncbi:MAG TPA: tetratricopeptide repeat protein, partial [Micavibrio sp.]
MEKRPLVQRHEKVTGSMREDSVVGDSADDAAQSANLAMGTLYNAKDKAAYEQALAAVQRLVDTGNMEAAFRLGRYFDLEVSEPDMNRAMSLYRMAAAKKHPWATNNIGYAFERAGEYDQALQYYKKAADLNEFHAYNSLARLYFTGRGVPRDQATGLAWLEQGMSKNIPEVYAEAAQIYYFGQYGFPEDYKKALYYYTKGGELGDHEAKWSAAKMYLEGDNIPVNGELGMKMLNELAALNDAQAINSIGAIHADGKAGFPVDKKKAVEYWEKSASLGFCRSMMN